MTIIFHCEHCGMKVSAPDEAGGRRGKCPRCTQHVFIPSPKENLDEIPIAPPDPTEESRRKELRMEELRLQQELQEHQDSTNAPQPKPEKTSETKPASPEANIRAMVDQYILYMSKGNPESAEPICQKILTGGNKSLKIVEEMAMQDLPSPQLANIPQNQISSYFKKLLSRFPK